MNPLIKLFAMEAVAYAERLALAIFKEEAIKITGPEKFKLARLKLMEQYSLWERGKFLDKTDVDNALLDGALQEVFDSIGGFVNQWASTPEKDPELPEGGVQ